MYRRKWEYLHVRIFSGRVEAIDNVELKKPQPIWEIWLGEKGLEGWELASEVGLANLKIKATLKRPIPRKRKIKE